MERDAFDRDALDRLADVLMEDIAATSGDDLLAEVEEDYGDASLLARAFDEGLARAEAVALPQSNETANDNAVSVATEKQPSGGATAREEPPRPAQPVGVVRSGQALRASFAALVAGFTATLRSHPEMAAFTAVLLLFVVLAPANLRTSSTVGPAPSSPSSPSTCRDGGAAGCSPALAAGDGVPAPHFVSHSRCGRVEGSEAVDNPGCADAAGGAKPDENRQQILTGPVRKLQEEPGHKEMGDPQQAEVAEAFRRTFDEEATLRQWQETVRQRGPATKSQPRQDGADANLRLFLEAETIRRGGSALPTNSPVPPTTSTAAAVPTLGTRAPANNSAPSAQQCGINANRPKQIRRAQVELIRLACLKGQSDGQLNDETRHAVIEFVALIGTPPPRCITDKLIADMQLQRDGACSADRATIGSSHPPE